MQEVLQDLEFYEKQSMLDNCEINKLRCELQTSMDKVEKERANSWTRIVELLGFASAGAVAASTMALGTAASGAGTFAVGSSTAMFGASASLTSAATASTAAASAAMFGTGASMGLAAETAAVGAALSCVIS